MIPAHQSHQCLITRCLIRCIIASATAAASFSLHGCGPNPDLMYAIEGHRPGEQPFIAQPCPPDRSVIYVYWPSSFMNAYIWCDVTVDDQPYQTMMSRTYLRYELPPGQHTVKAIDKPCDEETFTSVDIECKAGQISYITVSQRIRFDNDYPVLKHVAAKKGEKEIAKTKQPKPRDPQTHPASHSH